MKKIRFFSLAMAFWVVALSIQGPVRADMGAQGIVNRFNAASGGTKMQFNYGSNYEVEISQRAGYGFADTSAYAQGVTGGPNFYRTLCVEPTVGVTSQMSATLNYANNKTTTSSGYALTLGAAYIYSKFATGTLSGYTYDNNGYRSNTFSSMSSAIRGLMGLNTMSWTSGFALQLLSINNDKSFWTQAYDPNKYYSVIGDYSVFVMNCYNSSGGDGQDFLYVAKASNSSDVPEPASVLLWGLGSLGAFGATRRARNRRLKLA